MSAQAPQLDCPHFLQEFIRVSPDTPPPVIRAPGLTHVCCSAISYYDYIDPNTLVSLDPAAIDRFRSFIRSVSPGVSFATVLESHFRGTCLMTAADVTSFLDTQTIVVAWEAVLKMVRPINRAYDLKTIRLMKLGVGSAAAPSTPDISSSGISAMLQCPPLTNIHMTWTIGRQPPNSENTECRLQPRRGGGGANTSKAVPSTTDAAPDFRRWELNSVVTLQIPDLSRIPASTVNHARAIPTHSGFRESLTPQLEYRVANPPLTPQTPRMAFRVTQLITPTVAVLSSCSPSALGHSVIGKIPRSPKHLTSELNAYMALANLQGREIPHCYGVCQVGTAPSNSVLLIELISPVKTVQSLRDAGDWETLQALRTPARLALEAIHDAGVVHQDAYARNFLVTEVHRKPNGIVVVDFDVAKSYPNEPERRRLRVAGDWAFFNEAFGVDEEEEWGQEEEEEGEDNAGNGQENTADQM